MRASEKNHSTAYAKQTRAADTPAQANGPVHHHRQEGRQRHPRRSRLWALTLARTYVFKLHYKTKLLQQRKDTVGSTCDSLLEGRTVHRVVAEPSQHETHIFVRHRRKASANNNKKVRRTRTTETETARHLASIAAPFYTETQRQRTPVGQGVPNSRHPS